MTPVMLPTSEWSAKWCHLHKWKFFHEQIELTCRFSKTLKGVLYPRGLSTLEVEAACCLLMLVCCMAHWGSEGCCPSQKWGGGDKESRVMNFSVSWDPWAGQVCLVFQSERTSSFPCTTLGGFLLVTSVRASGRPLFRAALSLHGKDLLAQWLGIPDFEWSTTAHRAPDLQRRNLTP